MKLFSVLGIAMLLFLPSWAEGQEGQKHPSRATNSFGMEFVLIQPGAFVMGSSATEENRNRDEVQHQVTITTGF